MDRGLCKGAAAVLRVWRCCRFSYTRDWYGTVREEAECGLGSAGSGMVLAEKIPSLLVESRKKRTAGRGARRVFTRYARDVDQPTAKLL